MPQALDGKFYGLIFRQKDNQPEPPDSFMVFVARDNAFPATLRFYREECERLGAAQAQLAAVDMLIAKVDRWRAAHPDRLKVPDVHPGELSW